MAPSSSPSPDSPSTSSPSPSFSDNTLLQPYFVLHKASSRPKTRRKIDLSLSPAPSPSRQLVGEAKRDAVVDDQNLESLRFEAFCSVWSRIDTTIKSVLNEININMFNDVNSWVHESFRAVRLHREPGFAESTRPYPVVTDALSKQIFTALVYTKNMDFVDDQLTFEELANHLKSHGCHVANMTSLNFSAKSGVGGCLTRLLRQFLTVTVDGADMSILASWYSEQTEYKPLVIIIEDMERCCGSILSNFILMISEWVVKIPVVLVMGIATTLDAPRNLLLSNALLKLRTSKFILGSPAERMNAIVEAVLLRSSSWFSVGHKVALFMRDYFLKHDGTLTSFVRALKIACMQHFSTEHLSFLLKQLDAENVLQKTWMESHVSMQDVVLKHCSELTSCSRVGEQTSEKLVHGLTELKRLHRHSAAAVMCLYEVGKSDNIQLLDLYSEALDTDSNRFKSFYNQGTSLGSGCFSNRLGSSRKTASICQALQKIRDLPPAALSGLVNSWERHAEDISEICQKVKELQCMMKSVDSKNSGCHSPGISSRNFSRRLSSAKDPDVLKEKVVALIEWLIRDHMQPIEGLPYHEILCFKDVDKLQTALLGDPRKKIQADLLEFHKYMCCSCCSSKGNRLLPSLHDTSILYMLAQEHGDIINVHDWYQSFKAVAVDLSNKARSKSKRPRTPKKKKDTDCPESESDAAIQARFCKALSELQITGLLRMPSKRRPDYVQRVAFGL